MDRAAIEVLRQASVIGADSVWITLSTPGSILFADRLIEMGADLRVTVWDPPEYILEIDGIRGRSVHRVLGAFSRVLTGARSVAVVSTAMQREYLNRYAIQSHVIRHGLPSMATATRGGKVDPIRLVFAGSLYAKSEWNALIGVLEEKAWEIAGRAIEVIFIGRFPATGARKGAKVHLAGELDFEACRDIVTGCDLAYLPYWLSEDYRLAATFAFPGKLSMYLACGIPVFHHGPAYAEVSTVIIQYGVGVNCHSLQSADICNRLEEVVGMMGDPALTLAITEAFRQEVSESEMASRFNLFMGSVS